MNSTEKHKKLLIFTFFMLLALYGCANLGSFDYTVHEDINFHFKFKKAKYYKKSKAVFLFYQLDVSNYASDQFYFNPGELKAKMNGHISEEAHYDTYASNLPHKEVLEKGENIYYLYFVLPGIKDLDSIEEFSVINFGLSQSKEDK